MSNSYFQFKEFRIEQAISGMKVTTDACLFGAWVANELQRLPKEFNVLDIGTGTGVLSLMVAQMVDKASIISVEVNPDAYAEATENFAQSHWSNRLTCRHTSIQNFAYKPCDIIICNPPFYKDSQKGKSQNKNEAVHSNLLPKGDLLEAILRLLSAEGTCYLLYPEREMKEFISLAKDHGLFAKEMIEVRNAAKQAVFRLMVSFSRQQGETKIQWVDIRESDGRYTQLFWDLLKKFYLEYNNPKLL